MPDLKFKLVFLGPALSGKTSICNRFLTNIFNPSLAQTIGIDFCVTTFNIGKLDIKLYIWDFGGEERFEFFYKDYIRNSNGAIIVFDLNNKRDYDKILKYISIIKRDNNDKPYAIIGNKLDLVSDTNLIKERNEIKEYYQQEQIPYLETSAKSNINIENLFLLITKEMITSKMISKYSNLYNREELKNISNVKIITEDDHIFIANQLERIDLFLRDGNFKDAIILGESAKFFSQRKNLRKWSKKVEETLKKIDMLLFQRRKEVKKEVHKLSSKSFLSDIHIPFRAYKGKDPYIFVCYAHKDKELVYDEIRWIKSKDFRIWYDEGIPPTTEWPEEIERAIKNCTLFLVFITPNAVGRENVRNEINYALKKGKKFLAVFLEPTELKFGLELRLSLKQAILKYELNKEIYLEKLLETLNSIFLGIKKDV